MPDILIFLGIITAWFALQKWILPKLGIPTCMSGSCSVEQKKERRPPADDVSPPGEQSDSSKIIDSPNHKQKNPESYEDHHNR